MAQLRKEKKNLIEYFQDVELEVERNKYEISKMGFRQDAAEEQIRRKHLMVEGLNEGTSGHEDIHAVVRSLFRAMGAKRDINYDQAYRVGQFREQRKRAVFISFTKTDDRDYIFRARAELNKSETHVNVWINDDVTPRIRRTRNVMREVARTARATGNRCTSTPSAVTIDGKRYDAANLDSLPTELALEKMKTKQINDDMIAYHSEYAPFSNLYPCHIIVGKHEFQSLEQILQYKRAQFFKKPDLATKILLSRDVYEVRQFGQEAGKSKEWNEEAKQVVYAAMIKKFNQNPHLLEKLLGTGDKTLVEATQDIKWGIGASLNSGILKRGEAKGENLQGKILMSVRDQLRSEADGKATSK